LPSTPEVDGGFEVRRVTEPTGGLLDALDDGVDGFQARIGDLVRQVGEQVREMALDQLDPCLGQNLIDPTFPIL
jgi:hypothetical protein